MKRLMIIAFTGLGLLTGCDDSGTVAKLAYETYTTGGFIGEDTTKKAFVESFPLTDQVTFINYYRCLHQRNSDIWDEVALNLTHPHGKDLILDTKEKENLMRTIGYCCQTKTHPNVVSLDDLYTLFGWSNQGSLNQALGRGLAIDFPKLLHEALTEAVNLNTYDYHGPNEYLLHIKVPSAYFESKLNLARDDHKALWKAISEKESWGYNDLAILLSDHEEHDPLQWISTGMTKSLCQDNPLLTEDNVKGELARPLQIFTKRYACRTVAEATLNAMMIALRQGLCVVETARDDDKK